MKKFKFSLESVLRYKNMVLEELKREHGLITAKIIKQEEKIQQMEQEYIAINNEFNEKKEQGISVLDATSYKTHIHVLQVNIKEEHNVLERLKAEEQIKRKEVINARVETSSLDKLKEKYIEEYNMAAQKEMELFIEEFVANKRSVEV